MKSYKAILAVLVAAFAISVGLYSPSNEACADPVSGSPQYSEAIGWTGNAKTGVDCVRMSILNYDGGVSSIPEYAEGEDGGYSFTFDAAIVDDAATVGLIVVNNTPTLTVGARYRAIVPEPSNVSVYVHRGSAAATTGGSIYIPVDVPEEQSFSPRNVPKSRLYGRCSTGTSCYLDLCPLYTPNLGGK